LGANSDNSSRALIRQHWFHWGAHLLGAFVGGVLVIPFFRVWPESVHKFAQGLADWQRVLLTFSVCLLVAYLLFRLFTPRFRHLTYWRLHPPIWFAWFIAFIAVAAVDLAAGLSEKYQASWGEWVGYGVGALTLVAGFRCLVNDDSSVNVRVENNSEQAISLANSRSAKPILEWDQQAIISWLKSDEPASRETDVLGNYSVAERIKERLELGARSIGIVGPYGAGKTSIVRWLVEKVAADRGTVSPRLLISEHSCWKFESSTSSIHAMLADAIEKVGYYIDTFFVRSLPESYREMISSSSGWLEGMSGLLFRSRDPISQFEQLNALLEVMNARLVFVVEDLDRNESRTFDVQEVQAFLQQLKDFPNLAFVLTGGVFSAGVVDFVKLCDHIEQLKSIDDRTASQVTRMVRLVCLETKEFKHQPVALTNRGFVWGERFGFVVGGAEEMSLSQSVAALLSTPRALRHAFGRTYMAWRYVCGEVDWDHLLAVNVLRFGAPECFAFLIRRWGQLRNASSDGHLRHVVTNDWRRTVEGAEWNPKAAVVVMSFLLPKSAAWLGNVEMRDSVSSALQGIHEEKYWLRALSEAVDPQDVRDQDVLDGLRSWLKNPQCDAEFVIQVCESSAYGDIWNNIASRLIYGQPDKVATLGDHVLSQLREKEGVAATGDSLGFRAVCRFMGWHIRRWEGNRKWLECQIEKAASVSIELVIALWEYYGKSQRAFLVSPDESMSVREKMIQVLRDAISDSDALGRLLHPERPYGLYRLVLESGGQAPLCGKDISEWAWLGPILLEGLRGGSGRIAVETARFLGVRAGTRPKVWAVNMDVLNSLFGADAAEVIDLLGGLAGRILEPTDRHMIEGVVRSAREALSCGNDGGPNRGPIQPDSVSPEEGA